MARRGRAKVDILSFSLSRDLAGEVDALMEEMGYQNRSEVIRDALHPPLHPVDVLVLLQEDAEGVALVLYRHRAEREVHEILHGNQGVFRSFLHLDFGAKASRCCDVVVFRGPAEQVREALHAIETTPQVEKVNLTLL